jgi:hypothetical protein
MKASWQIIFSAATKKKRYAEENTTCPRLRKSTPTHIHAKLVKNAETQHQHNQATNT